MLEDSFNERKGVNDEKVNLHFNIDEKIKIE